MKFQRGYFVKRTICIAVILLLCTAVLTSVPVFAAAPFSGTAKANKPTLDGSIDLDEYGAEFELSSSTGIPFAGTAFSSPITYWFAWDRTGLYVAFSFSCSLLEGFQAMHVQLNVNPGGYLYQDGYRGLFLSLVTQGGKITAIQHNYPTKLQDGIGFNTDESMEITAKVQSAYQIRYAQYIGEVFIPMDFFRIIGNAWEIDSRAADYTFRSGETLTISPFAYIDGEQTISLAAVGGSEVKFQYPHLSLGTLKLEAAGVPNQTSGLKKAAVGFIIIASVNAFTLIIVLPFCRKRRSRY